MAEPISVREIHFEKRDRETFRPFWIQFRAKQKFKISYYDAKQ